MHIIDRRAMLQRLAVGTGAVALTPFLNHMSMAANGEVPKRFVFVLKASGLHAQFLNPTGLKHGGRTIVDSTLEGKALPYKLAPLEPLKDKVTIIQGLGGRQCAIGHSSYYGALGGFKSPHHTLPSAATIDGHFSKLFPSVFNRIGLKMGTGTQGVAYPDLSSEGKNRQMPFQCNPQFAYANLFGSIAVGGDIRKKYTRTGNVLDAMRGKIKRLRTSLPSQEKEKLDFYLSGFEALKDRRVKLIDMQDVLRKDAPEVTDIYNSKVTTHHLEAHFEMATAALITGISNVITISCDDLSSSYEGIGISSQVHAIGHGARSGDLAAQECRSKMVNFNMQLIAGMANKLSQVPEGNGTMLDNTLIIYLSDNADQHHASNLQWPIVVVGNQNGRLKSKGRYIAYPHYNSANGVRTIGNWLTTLTHLAGVPQDYFGQPDLALGSLKTQAGPLSELLA
jgi:hypothetical protein